jgi:hypothetical protein
MTIGSRVRLPRSKIQVSCFLPLKKKKKERKRKKEERKRQKEK